MDYRPGLTFRVFTINQPEPVCSAIVALQLLELLRHSLPQYAAVLGHESLYHTFTKGFLHSKAGKS